jgi:integrase
MSNVTTLPFGPAPAPIGATDSMPRCLEQHIAFLRQRGLSEQTIKNRANILIGLRQQLGFSLYEATAPELGAWRAGLQLGPDAVVNYVWHVRDFYDWAVQARKVRRNPAAKLPVPRLGRRLPRPIEEAPLLYAVESADYPVRTMLVLAGWAGLRAKEIALLRRQNVLDKAREPVLVVASDATKGRRERTVPMSPFVVEELLPVLPQGGYVFRRKDGQHGPNTPGRVSQMCNQHLHQHGIPETLHQLRHRFGTGTYQNSHDLRVVQELLGHQSPVSTAGYAAYDNSDAQAAVKALPAPRRLRAVGGG